MTDGEGNKPAISLLEQQEQQKRRPVAPSQTPAPYVQPYRPLPAVPPIPGQANFSGPGAEGSLRGNLSNASYSHVRAPASSSGALAAGVGAGGSITSVATNITDGLAAPYNHAQVSQLLAYTQQQLTQLQQVQTLLLQHMQALHQLQGSPEGAAISLGGSIAALDALPRLRSGLAEAPPLGSLSRRANGYGPPSSAASPTQMGSLGNLLSSASPAASLPPDHAPAAQPNLGATTTAMGPRPPSGAGAAALQMSPARAGASSPPAARPPQPPAQAPAAPKEHPSLGSAACPGTPAPGSPESAATAGALPSKPPQPPPPQPPPLQQHPQAVQTQPQSEQGRPTSQQHGQELQSLLPDQQPQPQRPGDAGLSLPSMAEESSELAGALTDALSGPDSAGVSAARPQPEAAAGSSQSLESHPQPGVARARSSQSLESHPLMTAEGPTAAAVARNVVGLEVVRAAGSGSSALVGPSGGVTGTDGSATGAAAAAVATAAAGDADRRSGAPSGTMAPGTDLDAPTPTTLVPTLPTLAPADGPERLRGSALTSVFAEPGPSVQLPSNAAADDMRPLDIVSLSLGLQPWPPQGFAPPPPGLDEWPTQIAAPGFGQPLTLLEPPGATPPLAGLPGPPQLPAANGAGDIAPPPTMTAVQWQQHDATAAAAAAAAALAAAGGMEPKEELVAPTGPELDAQLNANRKDFLVFADDEDDGEEDEEVDVKRKAWYRQSGVLWFMGSALVGIVLLVAGMCMHLRKFSTAAAEAEVFRWLYFVAGYVPIYWVVYFVVSRTFMLVEWVYFRENLFYLENVKVNATALISMLFQLLWFMACFEWLWCEKGRCSSSSYASAKTATWKAVLCIMLFTLANLLKSVTAKFSSMHFYRTAHFKKLKDSLEKEYYLQLLSVPRSRIVAHMEAAEAEAEAQEGGKYRLKTVLARRSLFPPSSTLQRLSRRTPLANMGSGGEAAGAGSTGDGAVAGSKSRLRKGGTGGSGGGAGAELQNDAAAADASQQQPLGRSSTAPARRNTWAGFWRWGDTAREAEIETTQRNGPGRQRDPQAALSHGDKGGRRYAGSPPKWSGNALAATSTVSSASTATPPGRGGSGGDGGGGSGSTANGFGNANGRSDGGPRGSVTVVVMGDEQSLDGAAGGQAVPQPPPPPAALPAPPPPPPPARGSGEGGALGLVRAEPFLAQTSAFFDRAGPAPSTQEQHEQQQQRQQQQVQGQSAQLPPDATAAAAATGGSGGRLVPWQLVRLISRVFGSGSGGPEAAGPSAAGASAHAAAMGAGGGMSRSYSGLPPRRLKTIVGEAIEGMGPHLQRRLAELGAEVYNAVPLGIKKKKAVHDMTEAELERIRDAIVIKTYTALIRKHTAMSEAAQLRELKTVRRFAKALYFNIRGPDDTKTHITLDDFKLFFGDDETMAQKAFKVFDSDRDDKLTRVEIRDRVVAIYAERRNMARSLRDTDSIVRSLELSLGVVIHFLFGAVYLTIWGVPLLEGFSTFSATVLALTFIFGNSAKNAFESVLFLFSEHPYDVGDMVYFNGDSMRVKRISLMYTDFVKWTNEEVYIPNTKMMNVDLTNWTRTRTKFELHKILVDVGVAWEVKEDITAALAAHCNAYPNDFCGVARVTFREVVDPLKVYLGIGFTYNFPPDDFDRLVPARDRIMYVVQSKLAEHRLSFSNHRINHLVASEEIRMAIQMRQLKSLEGEEKRLLDDLAALSQQPAAAAGLAAAQLAAAAGDGSGSGTPGGGTAPAGSRPLPPELLMSGGGGVGSLSALPALGADGLQQRPAAAAAAAVAAAAAAAAAVPGAKGPAGHSAAAAGGDQAGKPKKD